MSTDRNILDDSYKLVKHFLYFPLWEYTIASALDSGHKSMLCVLDAATLSGILKAKQKLGVTFNSDKLGGIDFTKFSKLSMCSAGAGRCWLVQWPGLPPRHCTWSVLKFLQKQCRLAYWNQKFYLVFASLSKSLTTVPHLFFNIFTCHNSLCHWNLNQNHQ